MNPNYDLKKIKTLLKMTEGKGMNFEEKWTHIGEQFGVSRHAVRKWYYRAIEKTKAKDEKHITSDQWRNAYLILTGTSNRDKISTIKRKIVLLCEDEPIEA